MTRRSLRYSFVAFVFTAFSVLSGHGQSIAPASGKALCSALTVVDFNKVGMPVTRAGAANLDGPANAYCVYESKAGKVEFDIFFPAGENSREVDATERTAIGEAGSAKIKNVSVTGADRARLVPVTSSGSLSIVVRKGTAVFNIDVPNSAFAQDQLIILARTVLGRLKQ